MPSKWAHSQQPVQPVQPHKSHIQGPTALMGPAATLAMQCLELDHRATCDHSVPARKLMTDQ